VTTNKTMCLEILDVDLQIIHNLAHYAFLILTSLALAELTVKTAYNLLCLDWRFVWCRTRQGRPIVRQTSFVAPLIHYSAKNSHC